MELAKEFFEEDMRFGYRVSENTKKVWAVYLDLLEVFQKICVKNNLRFFMGFGTLLGAVRHGGFIPWDDDVDILMPRDDFEQIQKLDLQLTYPYFLQTSQTDSNFWQGGMIRFCNSRTTCISKANFYSNCNQGIAIEILPLDHAPNDKKKNKALSKKISVYQKILRLKLNRVDKCRADKKNPIIQDSFLSYRYTTGEFLSYVLSKNFLKKKINQLCTLYAKENTGKLSIYTSVQSKELCLFAHDFSSSISMQFENLKLPAPIGFWRCLEEFYDDDFLGYVPLAKRMSHHAAFWAIDESFDIYKKRLQDTFKNTAGKIIVIFGTGNMVKSYIKRTKGKFVPSFYVDNDSNKWGKLKNSLPIKSPETLLEYPKEKLHIIVCNNYFREIGKQLRSMGLDEYYIYMEFFNSFFTTPNEIDMWSSIKKTYKIGYLIGNCFSDDIKYIQLLKNIKKKCGFLIVGIDDSSLGVTESTDKKEFLSAIKYVDRIIDINTEQLPVVLENYHCDCVFLSARDAKKYKKLINKKLEIVNN